MASEARAEDSPVDNVGDKIVPGVPSANSNQMIVVNRALKKLEEEDDEIFQYFQTELKKIHLRNCFQIGPNAREIGWYKVPREKKYGWLLYREVEIRIKDPTKIFTLQSLNDLKKKYDAKFVIYGVTDLRSENVKIEFYELTESNRNHFCKVMQGDNTGLPQKSSRNILNFGILASYNPSVNKNPYSLDFENVSIVIGGYLQKTSTSVENATAARLMGNISSELERSKVDSGSGKKNAGKSIEMSGAVVAEKKHFYPKISRQGNRINNQILRDLLINVLMSPGQISTMFSNPLSLKIELESRLKSMFGRTRLSAYEEIMNFICTTRLHEIENGQVYSDLSTECENLLYESRLRKMKLLPSSLLYYLETFGGITCTHALLQYAKAIDEIVESFLSYDKSDIPPTITRNCQNTDECMESLHHLLSHHASFKTDKVWIPIESEYGVTFVFVVSFLLVGNTTKIKYLIEKLPIALWISYVTSFGSNFKFRKRMLHTVLSGSLLNANEKLVRQFLDSMSGVKVVGEVKLSQMFAQRQLDDSEAGIGAVSKRRNRVLENNQEETTTEGAPGEAPKSSPPTDLVVDGKRKRKPTERVLHSSDSRIRRFFGIHDFSAEPTNQESEFVSAESGSGSESDGD